LVEKSKEISPVWESLVKEFSFPQEDGFYLFMEDSKTGLNTDVPNFKRIHPRKKWGYRMMRFLHHFAFVPGAPLFKTARWFFRNLDGSRVEIPFTELEYWVKFASSRCQRCGDCTLSEMAFLCPQSQCAKFLLNGQCGGSREGWCEVFPGEKRCIYVRAYKRLRACGEEESMKDSYIPPRNWDLAGTSSWANYFLGRDHQGIT
jgi:methylenetetrahydrofolate reductase (NADPH)